MNAAYSPRRKYVIEGEIYIEELLETIELLKSNKNCQGMYKAMLQCLHTLVCRERLSREDLVKIKKTAKNANEDFIVSDCDSRLRNLAAN